MSSPITQRGREGAGEASHGAMGDPVATSGAVGDPVAISAAHGVGAVGPHVRHEDHIAAALHHLQWPIHVIIRAASGAVAFLNTRRLLLLLWHLPRCCPFRF